MGIAQVFILIVISLLMGVAVSRLAPRLFRRYEVQRAESKAKDILKRAKQEAAKLKRERIVEAKERAARARSAFEQETEQKKAELDKLKERFYVQQQEVKRQLEQLQRKEVVLETARQEIRQLQEQRIKQLEEASEVDAQTARRELLEAVEAEVRSEATTRSRAIVEEAKAKAEQKARNLVLTTLQRVSAEETIQRCSSTISIDDRLKGKIIGKAGRNIQALEAATGVDMIVDDTPETITLSSFDPVRREIARIALQQLIEDGRIHPVRIEEVVSKVQANIDKEIMDTGEQTVIDLGIYGMNLELIKLVGRMRYRYSYGQNLLHHSREVANLSTLMAAEMGLDVKLAKRAGLLHDIGKVAGVDKSDLSHALLGMELATKYKEHPEVCNAIGAHHDEIEMTAMISPVVQACDSISGARPGARREVLEAYAKRLHEMEDIALGFPGVQKCYAIQAGRELRVMVDAANVSDEGSQALAFDISRKLEQDLQYPGQIRVTVIRETRAVHYAK